MYIFRYLIYQTSTKAFDKDFQIEIDSEDESYFTSIFNSPDLHYWFYLIRSKAFLDHQDMIVWNYVLSPKIFNDQAIPYLIVCHKDVDGIQSVEVLPRYFKNTKKHKITPNLFDLETMDLRLNKLGEDPYSKSNLYRNCLQTQSLESHIPKVPFENDLDFSQNRMYENCDPIVA